MDPNKKEDVNTWCSKTEPFLGYNNENPVKNQNNEETVQTSQEGKKLFQYIITLSASLIGMQSGMTLGWTSPILPFLSSKRSFIPQLTEDETSWITSLLALGAILGAVPAGKIADYFGRKLAMALTAIPFLISWITLIFSRNIIGVYVARFVGGIGSGAACVLVPVYIGEIAQASIRGMLGTFFPLLFSFGIVFSYVMGAYLSYTIFNVSCCFVLTIFLVIIVFLPESPMWLVHQEKKSQAVKVLKILRGVNYDVKEEISTLQDEADRVEAKRGGIMDLIGTKAGRKAFGTCLGLMWFQQMSGIDAVLFYTVRIFQNAGSTIEPFVATIVIGLIEVIMTICVVLIIDRFGRKPLLIISGVAMTLCLGVLGYYFKIKTDGKDVLFLGWVPLTCLSLFNVVFSIGYGSVPFAMISELFPPETKGVASSISIMVHWSLVFAVTKLFPKMENVLGEATTFWTFACFTALSAAFAFFFVPETKGKTLQDIQKKLERKRKLIKDVQSV
ncbi:facilitated trehalose transporter Tret1-2 homolog isoform X1 [Vespa velutina]|uniref:facilitated trehalose transporter Tret1-2 homolog isoform X1 n=1 Tax=Vespa velutina TaxID=202808 RepID=UPI001FB330EF|nr:facilitated trehalose transporter Tret1-2 homolog isoform X1 [Vespa velutina]